MKFLKTGVGGLNWLIKLGLEQCLLMWGLLWPNCRLITFQTGVTALVSWNCLGLYPLSRLVQSVIETTFLRSTLRLSDSTFRSIWERMLTLMTYSFQGLDGSTHFRLPPINSLCYRNMKFFMFWNFHLNGLGEKFEQWCPFNLVK